MQSHIRLNARHWRRHAVAAAVVTLATGISYASESYFDASLTNFVRQPSDPTIDMMLVAPSTDSLRFTTWDSATQHWKPWTDMVYPVNGSYASGAHVPLVSWYGFGNGGWHTNGYYNANGLGAPFWTQSGQHAVLDLHGQIVDTHGNRFLPGSGIARLTTVQYLHFFGGTTYDASCGGTGLRERWWDPEASQWNWAYHGCPSQSPYLAGPTTVGAQSAATTEQVPYSLQHTFVFATVNHPSLGGRLWVRHASTARPYRDTHEPWAWLNLGRPDNTTAMDTEPLTVSYDKGNHVWRTHVFIAARSTVDNQYHLYERYTDGDNWTAFSAWTDHGKPPGLNSQATNDKRFRLSTGIIRHDPGRNGGMRICLYGSSFHGSGINSGQLVEHRWTGSNWTWEQSDVSPERDASGNPVPLRVSSATTGKFEQRVSIVGVSDTHRLWERFWDTAGNWQWKELTTHPEL